MRRVSYISMAHRLLGIARRPCFFSPYAKQELISPIRRTSTQTTGNYIRTYSTINTQSRTSRDMSQSSEPFIVRFYSSGARDDEGRDLDDILKSSDEALEQCHDYIQLIFPVSHSCLLPAIGKPSCHQLYRLAVCTTLDHDGKKGDTTSLTNRAFSCLSARHTTLAHPSSPKKSAMHFWEANISASNSPEPSPAWPAFTPSMSLETRSILH